MGNSEGKVEEHRLVKDKSYFLKSIAGSIQDPTKILHLKSNDTVYWEFHIHKNRTLDRYNYCFLDVLEKFIPTHICIRRFDENSVTFDGCFNNGMQYRLILKHLNRHLTDDSFNDCLCTAHIYMKSPFSREWRLKGMYKCISQDDDDDMGPF